MSDNSRAATACATDVAQRYAAAILPPEILMSEYERLLEVDAEFRTEALRAAHEMRFTPVDELDARPVEIQRRRLVGVEGKINRRAPANPFHSPMLGKFKKTKTGTVAKVEDPALARNPLRGRLITTISINAGLFLVFVQSLILNRLESGSFYASRVENSNIGPSSMTLYALGGLNANAIRAGEWIRLLWSMWMHSGWIHILFNIACQLQFFYMLEPDWGILRTLFCFWFSGISGNLLSVVLDPCKTTVGSSGGLFGLMGAIIPYCIEFWHSIPRPMCILLFSVFTVLITLATGLTKSTDTWAHVGGFIGGLLFGCGTMAAPAAFLPKDMIVPQPLRRNRVLRFFQNLVSPECLCGPREWIIRILSWILLIAMWATCLTFLYAKYEYQPIGSLTFSGITNCCCCYDTGGLPSKTPGSSAPWLCLPCEMEVGGTSWGRSCEAQGYHL